MVTLMYGIKSRIQTLGFQIHSVVIIVDQHRQGMNPNEVECQFGTHSITSQTQVHDYVIT